MCVMAAVSQSENELDEFTDRPNIAHSVPRDMGIALNDVDWGTRESRANGMRRFGVAVMGSVDCNIQAFLEYVALRVCKELVPHIVSRYGQTYEGVANRLKEAKTFREAANIVRSNVTPGELHELRNYMLDKNYVHFLNFVSRLRDDHERTYFANIMADGLKHVGSEGSKFLDMIEKDYAKEPEEHSNV